MCGHRYFITLVLGYGDWFTVSYQTIIKFELKNRKPGEVAFSTPDEHWVMMPFDLTDASPAFQ